MSFEYKGTISDIPMYIASTDDDGYRATSPNVMLFGLQGNDHLYPSTSNSPTYLVGGSGNDTYINRGSMVVMDAGGGHDRIEFPGWSYSSFKNYAGSITSAIIDNRHLLMVYGGETIIVGDYQSSNSAIEEVAFNDGTVVSFQSAFNTLTSSSGYVGHVSWSNVYSAFGTNNGMSTSEAVAATNNVVSQYVNVSASFEQEEGPVQSEQAQGARDASSDDAYQVARLYKAAFNRIPDEAGLNSWIDNWESGMSITEIATHFMNSQEYLQLYANPDDNTDFVNSLYQNALGREADAGGLENWLNILNTGTLQRGEVLIAFSDSAENQANTNFTLTQSGDDWLL